MNPEVKFVPSMTPPCMYCNFSENTIGELSKLYHLTTHSTNIPLMHVVDYKCYPIYRIQLFSFSTEI